jgi:peroxiredoxin
MSTNFLKAGAPFPDVIVANLNGNAFSLGEPRGELDWKMIIVYRGKHCPICTNYLKTLSTMTAEFNAIGIDVAAVSVDPLDRATAHMSEVNPNFEVGYGISIDQMGSLGLFISSPRSDQETDRPFAEPGLFVVNSEGLIQVIDVSNAPFARPELSSLLKGLAFIRNPDNNYPIRGTY